jgi:hypothetical protein
VVEANKLIEYLNEGWELVKEIAGSKVIIRRQK